MKVRIHDEKRPWDIRGTAATAGCALKEVEVCMDRGLRHSGNVFESYAAQVPQVTEEVHRNLTKAEIAGRKAAQRAKWPERGAVMIALYAAQTGPTLAAAGARSFTLYRGPARILACLRAAYRPDAGCADG